MTKSPKKKFTSDQDRILLSLYREFDETEVSWKRIADKMGLKPRQVKERWYNYTDPNIKRGPFSNEEDILLMNLVKTHGTRWTKIAKFFPNRTAPSMRNRYLQLQNQARKNNQARKKNQVQIQPMEDISFPFDLPNIDNEINLNPDNWDDNTDFNPYDYENHDGSDYPHISMSRYDQNNIDYSDHDSNDYQ